VSRGRYGWPEILALTKIQAPVRPALSETLYRLSYSGHLREQVDA